MERNDFLIQCSTLIFSCYFEKRGRGPGCFAQYSTLISISYPEMAEIKTNPVFTSGRVSLVNCLFLIISSRLILTQNTPATHHIILENFKFPEPANSGNSEKPFKVCYIALLYILYYSPVTAL